MNSENSSCVIIRHILGKSYHLGLEYLVKRVDRADIEVAEVAVHPVHQLGIIVEGVKVRLDSEQRARIPEEAVQPDAQREVAALIRFGERLYRLDEALDDLVGIGGLADFFVVVLVPNRAGAVQRRSRACRCDCDKDKVVHVEVFEYLTIIERGVEPLALPAFDRLVPPSRPLYARQHIDRLEIQNAAKAFAGCHSNPSLCAVSH